MPLNNQVLLCGGMQNWGKCYLYDAPKNQWSLYASGGLAQHGTRGLVHQGKIYLSSVDTPEVFDPVTKAWSSWPLPDLAPDGACFVSWQGKILQLGGPNSYAVRSLNLTTKTWTTLTNNAPFYVSFMGCMVLPNQNILFTGGGSTANYQVNEYNVTKNQWLPPLTVSIWLVASAPVLINGRVLIFAASPDNLVFEYFYENRTIIQVKEENLLAPAGKPVVTAVPAAWFTHLLPSCTGI